MQQKTSPLYIQIQEYLAAKIDSGELLPGDKIPSERELSEQLGVSRMTVRQALTTLVLEGRLKRVQGAGTFVAEPKIEHELNLLISFTESAFRKGIKVSSKLLEFEKIPADKTLARKLELRIAQQVYRIVRVRFGNNVPILLERSYFPYHRCPDLEKFDLENQSIYHILTEEYGIAFAKMRQALEPVAANEFEAEMLNVAVGSPLMLVERITFDIDGLPIEYAKDIYRGDRSRFISEVAFGERHLGEGQRANNEYPGEAALSQNQRQVGKAASSSF